MDNDPISCADLGRDVMHSEMSHDAAGLAGGGLAAWGASETGPMGMAAAFETGQGWGHDYGPGLLGAIAYAACLPAEVGSEYGHAIGVSLHDLFSPAAAPTETHHDHLDSFAGYGGGHAGPGYDTGSSHGTGGGDF
jgi:hypothetical protein